MQSAGNGWSLPAVVVGVALIASSLTVAYADSRSMPHLHVKGRITTPDGRAATGAIIYQGPGWEQQLAAALNGVPSNCIESVRLSVKPDATYELVYLLANTAACVTAMNSATVDKSKILWTLPSSPSSGGSEIGYDYGRKL